MDSYSVARPVGDDSATMVSSPPTYGIVSDVRVEGRRVPVSGKVRVVGKVSGGVVRVVGSVTGSVTVNSVDGSSV
jgi:hypothetical protein